MSADKVVSIQPNPNAGVGSVSRQVTKRLGDVETLTRAILWVGLSTLVAVVVAFGALILDQMHFNNSTYREQTSNLNAQIQALQDEVQSLKNSPTSQ